MAVAHGCRLTRLPQAVGGVLTDRLEHPVPALTATVLGEDKRLVDEPAHCAAQAASGGPVGADGLCGLEREATGEYRQAAEDHLVRLVEEVVAPLHRRGERLLAGGRPARTADQEGEPVVESRID